MALEPITRQEKIIAGQDLTPITRMEMFLKEYGGGGSGLPSGGAPYQQLVTGGDGNAKWENRLAYETDPVLTEIIPQTTVTFSEMPGTGWMIAVLPKSFDLVDGQTYTILWDGTDYVCTGILGNGTVPALGNLGIMGAGDDTGEPFIFYNDGQWAAVSTESATEHVIGIKGLSPQIVPLDGKYLPPSAVRAFNFPKNVEHGQMVDAITAFKTGSASIVWYGSKVINAFYNSSADTISVTFAEEPLATITYSNRSGFYNKELGSVTYGELQGGEVRIVNDEGVVTVLSVTGEKSNSTLAVNADRISINGTIFGFEMILHSSTPNSAKKFKITVDDSGTISATEVTA